MEHRDVHDESVNLAESDQFYAPEIFMSCEKAMGKGNPDNLFFDLIERAFEKCPSEAIDYAVMEKMTSDNDKNPPPAGWYTWIQIGLILALGICRENKVRLIWKCSRRDVMLNP
ncbi:MAG: hypothetical protein CM1200mP3_09150 [Chloroflexota bacterium]|nr:MAG: hypothetical protein CM1200mP3_09150 [Chloroflexota bacterium]